MNTHLINKAGGFAKFVALLVTAALVAAGFAIHLSGTLATPEDIVVTLECESGISAGSHIEVGQTRNMTVSYLFDARSTDTAKATVSYTPGTSASNVRTTGVSAGVAAIAFGTKIGLIATVLYQITDSQNVSAYTIKDGGEVYFSGVGVSPKASPVSVTEGSFDRIIWKSMNNNVAEVASNGSITPKGLGATIVTGNFIDKWGVPRDLHLLVGVGVKLSDSNLGDLLELIQKGEGILANNPDQYTTDSLNDLQDAVENGKDILNGNNPSDEDIDDAIKDLQDAIGGMQTRPTTPTGIIGPDGEGNYYKPVGDPANIYEVVDGDGASKQPPEFVYNPDGDPVNKPDKNRPAHPHGGFYYVEDPDGSNIYKKVGGNGSLSDSPAIWGGPNGQFGGGDDEPVVKHADGSYWVSRGQNVWQKVETPTTLGDLTGGGPSKDPSATPGKPVYTDNNGKYYIIAGEDNDGNEIYYGDPVGGNSLLDSTNAGLVDDDVIYYKKPDGSMTTVKPSKPIVEPGAGNGVTGRILKKETAGDTSDWIEIARNGDYSLIVRANFIALYDSWPADDASVQGIYYGDNNKYINSHVQQKINAWFHPLQNSVPEKLAANANLRNYTVKNTASLQQTLGSGPIESGVGRYDGLSKPIADPDAMGPDIAFALSYGEAVNYISNVCMYGGTINPESNAIAKANFAMLESYQTDAAKNRFMWLRSPGNTATSASALYLKTGSAFQTELVSLELIYPAVWVDSAIWDGQN